MKAISPELGEALKRLRISKDFALVLKWLTDSRDQARVNAEASKGEDRTEWCGASRELSEVISRINDSNAAPRGPGGS